MNTPLALNIINLVEGEGWWLLRLLSILLAATLVIHIIDWTQKRLFSYKEKGIRPVQYLLLESLHKPLVLFIWVVALVFSLDVVTDHLFSYSFSKNVDGIFRISALIFTAWFLFDAKKKITDFYIGKSKKHVISIRPEMIHGSSKLVSITIFVLITLSLLDAFGVSITTFVAFGGVSGLAIAFAAQEFIANLFGGVMIHINQSFTIGDYISLPNNSISGTIEHIGWYQTALRTPEKFPLYVPNTTFVKAHVINRSRATHRKIKETIEIRQQDIKKAPAIIEAITAYLHTLSQIDITQPVLVAITNITTHSVVLSIEALVQEPQYTAFCALKNTLLLKVTEIINEKQALLATPLQTVTATIFEDKAKKR